MKLLTTPRPAAAAVLLMLLMIGSAIPAPAQPASSSADEAVRLTKKSPAAVILGEEYSYELDVAAPSPVLSAVVTDHVPSGSTYLRSEPAAQVEGDKLTWKIDAMNAGDTKSIQVWLRADTEGPASSCAFVWAETKVCTTTFAGKPVLAITKTGPDTAVINSDVAYSIVVANKGTAVAKNVVVTDTVPDGLASANGQTQLSWNVGDLAPNQSSTIPVTLKAVKRGQACNVAAATAGNAGQVTAQACTTVLVPGLKITKTGPAEQLLGRRAGYAINVANTGDTVLNGVTVSDTAPDGTSFVWSGNDGPRGSTATWKLGPMNPGTQKSLRVVLTSMVPGEHCNSAGVSCDEGLRDNAQACTVWKGVSALLLEKSDDPDPIQVGDTSTYTVKVTNQGTADDTNIKVVIEFPEEITPMSADNGGVISGKTVTFPAFPVLHAKDAFTFHAVGKGVQAGDARVTFIRTSDNIPAPTTAQESTRVY